MNDNVFVPWTKKLVMSNVNATHVAPLAGVKTAGTLATRFPFIVIVSSLAPSKS